MTPPNLLFPLLDVDDGEDVVLLELMMIASSGSSAKTIITPMVTTAIQIPTRMHIEVTCLIFVKIYCHFGESE